MDQTSRYIDALANRPLSKNSTAICLLKGQAVVMCQVKLMG